MWPDELFVCGHPHCSYATRLQVWAVVVLLALLKGGHGMPSVLGLSCGSFAYWAVVLAGLPALLLLSRQSAAAVCARHRRLVSLGYECARGAGLGVGLGLVRVGLRVRAAASARAERGAWRRARGRCGVCGRWPCLLRRLRRLTPPETRAHFKPAPFAPSSRPQSAGTRRATWSGTQSASTPHAQSSASRPSRPGSWEWAAAWCAPLSYGGG